MTAKRVKASSIGSTSELVTILNIFFMVSLLFLIHLVVVMFGTAKNENDTDKKNSEMICR